MWIPTGELTCPIAYTHTDGHRLVKQADDKRWVMTTRDGKVAVLSRRATFQTANLILMELVAK